MDGHVVSGTVSGASSVLAELGGDPFTIARQAWLPTSAFHDPHEIVPANSVARFFELAADRINCRHFSLAYAERRGLRLPVTFWATLPQTPTVAATLTTVADTYRIYTRAMMVTLVREAADTVGLCVDARFDPAISAVQTVEFVLACICLELRAMMTPDCKPVLTQFRHRAPASTRFHQRIFGPNLLFDQDRNCVLFGAANTLASVHQTPEQPRPASADPHDLADGLRVETAVRLLLSQSNCTLGTVSNRLQISPRSLQIQLARHNLSFQAILDRVRMDLAQRYLVDSDLNLTQIADFLQFAELSVFSRFVKSRTGTSPTLIRRSAQQMVLA